MGDLHNEEKHKIYRNVSVQWAYLEKQFVRKLLYSTKLRTNLKTRGAATKIDKRLSKVCLKKTSV